MLCVSFHLLVHSWVSCWTCETERGINKAKREEKTMHHGKEILSAKPPFHTGPNCAMCEQHSRQQINWRKESVKKQIMWSVQTQRGNNGWDPFLVLLRN